MNKSLITGVTGVVGSEIFRLVLLRSNDFVYVLVRGATPEAKIKTVFSYLDLEFRHYENRIQIINASAEDFNFKLASEQFSALAQSLSRIFNCAANVNLTQNYAEAKRESESSLGNLQRLLELNSEIKLEHVSTVGVNGRNVSGLLEERIKINYSFFNSYEAVKALIETQIYQLIDRGFKITIHRPSMIVGESTSGKIIHFQIFYFLLRLISGELTLGLVPPMLKVRLDTIPADFVADMIYQSSLDDSYTGLILHQCSGLQSSLSLAEILEILNQQRVLRGLTAKRPIVVPTVFFKSAAALLSLLPLGEKWRTRIQLLPQLLDYAQQDQIFHNQQTKNVYTAQDWPNPSDYLQLSIDYYLSKRYQTKHLVSKE